jgi:two-component system alkaline phosphatase synthesis response regulator PhoP
VKIYIVEDDNNIRDLVKYALSSSGFGAEGFADGEEMFAALQKSVPALILLDIMLPGSDGVTILRQLKSSGKTAGIPVIMLTAKGAEYDRVSGLDLGADDYITKPFSVMEMVARVRAVLRRSGPADEDMEFRIGDVVLSENRHSVHARGEEITLTFKEFELLRYLMRNKDIVLTRDQLLNQVWGYDYSGESRTVDMHIKTLRQKLGSSGSLVKTVRNVGYKIGE